MRYVLLLAIACATPHDAPPPATLEFTSPVGAPQWSTDNRFVAFRDVHDEGHRWSHALIVDVRTGAMVRIEPAHTTPLSAGAVATFQTDGHLIIIGASSHTILDTFAPLPPPNLDLIEPTAKHNTLSPDGLAFAATVADHPVIWSTGGAMLWEAPMPSAAARVAFAPDGSLVAASDAGALWHLELATETLRTGTLSTCGDGIMAFAVDRDGIAAATCRTESPYGTVLSIENQLEPRVTEERIYAAVASRGAMLWSMGRELVEYDLPGGTEGWTARIREEPSALSDDGRAFATHQGGDDDTRVYIRDAPDHQVGADLGPGNVRELAFSPDRDRLAALLDNGAFWVMRADTGDIDAKRTAPAESFAWDAFGLRIAYVTSSSIAIWTPSTHAHEEHAFPAPLPSLDRLAWSPDGAHLAAIGDGRVYVWDASRLDERPRTFAFSGAGAIAIHSDGSAAVVGNYGDATRLVRCVANDLAVPVPRCLRR
ncbi:MAG TPA: WD40 repeat domain-containing protein [Kofleriaceae bacterium]|jgi:WD40 repeat protein